MISQNVSVDAVYKAAESLIEEVNSPESKFQSFGDDFENDDALISGNQTLHCSTIKTITLESDDNEPIN